MSGSKILSNVQWQTSPTQSAPDAGFIVVYPKSTDGFWYTLSPSGTEKRIGLANEFKNGLAVSNLSTANPLDKSISLSIGQGLTFSGDFSGSQLMVSGITASAISFTGAATAGHVLAVAANGSFYWLPNASSLSFSGTTNSIAKFNGPSSLTASTITDTGSSVSIGNAPSFAVGKLNVDGALTVTGAINLDDNIGVNIQYVNGSIVQNSEEKHESFISNVPVLRTEWDTISSFTHSILNNLAVYGSSSGTRTFVYGSTGSPATFRILSSATSSFGYVDGTQGANKVLVSDANGWGRWSFIGATGGLAVSGLTLSISASYFTAGIVSTGATAGLAVLPGVAGSWGNSSEFPIISVDSYGRIRSINTRSLIGATVGMKSTWMDKLKTTLSASAYGATVFAEPIMGDPLQGSSVWVVYDGQMLETANGNTAAPFYIAPSPTGPFRGYSASNYIRTGDYVYFNPAFASFSITTGKRGSLQYDTYIQ